MVAWDKMIQDFLLSIEEESMWFALDLDRTLVDDNLVPFPGVVEILQFLSDRNYPMAVVSYNLNVEVIIPQLGWDSFFRKVICDRTRSKAQIIKDISPELELRAGDAILVDDLLENVSVCLDNGIHAIQVNPYIGFQMNEATALVHYHQLPVMWLSSLPIDQLSVAQVAFQNYFVRYYPSPITLDEMILYAKDNTTKASVVGIIQQHQDNYGVYHSLFLRDCETEVHSLSRSISLANTRQYMPSRVSLSDVLYQLFVLCIDHLEYEVREYHFEQDLPLDTAIPVDDLVYIPL